MHYYNSTATDAWPIGFSLDVISATLVTVSLWQMVPKGPQQIIKGIIKAAPSQKDEMFFFLLDSVNHNMQKYLELFTV